MTWELVYILSGLAVLPVFLIAIVVSIRVEIQIIKYSKVSASSGLTAKELVEQVAAQEHLFIRVEQTDKSSGDHYDPRDKAVRLTPAVYNSSSIAALAIAAHECGHAIQDEQNYAPLKMRQVVVKVSNFASRLLTPLIIISWLGSMLLLTASSYQFMKWLLLAFCVIYGLAAFLNFITLPTEFDASRRGKKLLGERQLTAQPTEQKAVNRVLRAAANTYVVAFAMSLLYLLRYVAALAMLVARRQD